MFTKPGHLFDLLTCTQPEGTYYGELLLLDDIYCDCFVRRKRL